MNNLTTSARQGVVRLLLLQATLTLLFSVVCGVFFSVWSAASCAIGGFIAMVGTAWMAACVFSEHGALAAKQIMNRFYRGEALKLLITAALFGFTFITVVNIVPGALLIGFIVAQACYWAAPWLFTAT